jgi:DNA-binding beta-propeller fold protein YncE
MKIFARVIVATSVFGAALVGAGPRPVLAAEPAPAFVTQIGGGTAGHAGMYPSGLDVDGAGNIYAADTGNSQIEKYDPSGSLLWSQGDRGPKAPGRFINPRDVAYLNGKVYVCDTGYNRVQVLDASNGDPLDVWPIHFGTIMGISAGVDGSGDDVILVTQTSGNKIGVYTPTGSLIRTVGSGPGSGVGQLNQPRDAATDASGDIFVADYTNSRVAVFGPGGGWIGAWGVNGTGPGQFKRPYGIDLDDAGDVYVADSNNYIHRFSWDPVLERATFVRVYGSPGTANGQFSMLRRVAVAGGTSPKVYGADLWTYRIEIFGSGGAWLQTIGGDPPATGAFNEPYGVAVNGSNVFVTDMVNQRVERFANDGTFTYQTAWGERGWGEGNPGFNWPKGLTLGTNGGSTSVWVADTKNNRVSEFFTDGTPTGRKFGKVGAAVGQLKWPFDVAAFGSRLVVADSNNNRVELWDPSGPSVVWAVSNPNGTAFSKPKAVDVDGGLVYVADTQNHRVVVLDASDGSFVQAFGSSQLKKADGVAVEPDGDVWVSDSVKQQLVEFSPSGAWLQNFGGSGSGPGKFNKPYHLDIFDNGNGTSSLFVVDSWNDRVQVFLLTG